MNPLRWMLVLCLPALMLCGCGKRAQVLTVQGGPSLGALFAELAAAYQADRPETRLVLKFTCPPCILYSGKGETAEFDLFASMGQFEIDRLSQEKVARFGEPVEIGTTTLSLVGSGKGSAALNSIADLHREDLGRIGVGDPDKAAVGHYTKQALSKAGLWDELKGRLVFAQSGCELLKWLGLERDIDAAIVFSVCREDGSSSAQTAHKLPTDLAPPVPVLLAASEAARNPQGAQDFTRFVLGPKASDILARYHVSRVAKP